MNKGIHGYPKGGVTAVTPNWGNGRFDTTPVVTNFSHTVPSFMGKGATANITFRSAADALGGAVSFSIDSQTSGLTFSKTAGIAANEIVVMSAPGQMPAAREVAFVVNAVSTSGGKTPVTIKVIILETVMWEFTTAGVSNWTAPVSGTYELLVVGGGGAGGFSAGAGGGSGWPDKIEAHIAAGQVLAVTVGSGGVAKTSGSAGTPNDPTCTGGNGGVSSIGTLISAMGGQGGSGGGNFGGNVGGAGGSGGGGGGGTSTDYPSGAGGTNGSNGQTPGAKNSESKGGVGAGLSRYSLLDTLTHGAGGNGIYSHGGGGGGGGWGPVPAAITTTGLGARGGTGAGYGAGGGGGGYGSAGANGVSGYVRIRCIGVDHV